MKFKNVVLVSGIFLCTFGMTVSNAFSDLSKEHWAYDKIMLMYNKGDISGFLDGTFKPEQSVTREQLATILCKTMGLKENSKKVKYLDNDRWSKEYIDIVGAFFDYVEIDGENYFYPTVEISRESVAKVLVKIKGLEDSEVKYDVLDKFTDKDNISKDKLKYIAIAVEKNIMNGNVDGTFNPKGKLTRAEITTLIYNLYNNDNKLNKQEYKFYPNAYPKTLDEFNKYTTNICKDRLQKSLENLGEEKFKLIYKLDDKLTTNDIIVDFDEDGIFDVIEENSAMDPKKNDTDNDGLCDSAHIFLEYGQYFNLKEDFDNDNLTNEEEILIYGTNFRSEDTDFDGIDDIDEINNGTNPLNEDTDGDGLTDLQEIEMYFDPVLKDTDGDGIIDSEEENIVIIKSKDQYDIVFEVEINAKFKDQYDIYYENKYNWNSTVAADNLSEARNIELNGHKGMIKVNISNISNLTPTMYYFDKEKQDFYEVEGQYIQESYLYVPINISGEYIIMNKKEWDELSEKLKLTDEDIKALESFYFLYTEVGKDWEVMPNNNSNIEFSKVEFKLDYIAGNKVYNKYALDLKLKNNKGYVLLHQNSMCKEIDFDAIKVMYINRDRKKLENAEYEIVEDEVRIKVNESGIYGIFYK